MLLLALCVGTACKIGREDNDGPQGDTLSEGESLGTFDRLPGGTAVPVDVRTLLALECTNDRLVLRTNLESLTASMPCERMLPASFTERFIGQPVSIRYENERLKVDNPVVGSIELPADEPQVTTNDATP
jgi:hypothetical protein